MARVAVPDPEVGLEFVGVDRFGGIADGALDEGMDGVLADVGDALDADAAPALDGPGDPRLVVAPVLALLLPADHRLVDLDHANERRAGERIVAHRLADAVAQVPRRLIGDTEGPLELAGADPLLALAHQVDGDEPLPQRKVRAMHNRSRRHAELIVAGPALPLIAVLDLVNRRVAAPDAGHAVRPTDVLQVVAAPLVRIVPIHQGNEVQAIHDSHSEKEETPEASEEHCPECTSIVIA